jgi:hypothetical protein
MFMILGFYPCFCGELTRSCLVGYAHAMTTNQFPADLAPARVREIPAGTPDALDLWADEQEWQDEIAGMILAIAETAPVLPWSECPDPAF